MVFCDTIVVQTLSCGKQSHLVQEVLKGFRVYENTKKFFLNVDTLG